MCCIFCKSSYFMNISLGNHADTLYTMQIYMNIVVQLTNLPILSYQQLCNGFVWFKLVKKRLPKAKCNHNHTRTHQKYYEPMLHRSHITSSSIFVHIHQLENGLHIYCYIDISIIMIIQFFFSKSHVKNAKLHLRDMH